MAKLGFGTRPRLALGFASPTCLLSAENIAPALMSAQAKMKPHESMSSASTSAQPHALLGLELLRFACAISVLVWHYSHFYLIGEAHVGFELTQQPLYFLLKPFYEAGLLGVQAFWSLSGFIFFWKYAQPVSRGQVSIRHFAVLRFSRLYPLHLLTLLIVAALAAWYRSRQGADYVFQFNDWSHFVLQLFMASEWAGRSEWSFNGPIWSISIEVLVYGLFYLLCRLGLTRWWQVLGLTGSTGVFYALKLTQHPIIMCAFFFYLGALTYLVHEALLKRSRMVLQLVLVMGLLAAGAGGWLVAVGKLRAIFYVALLTPVLLLTFLNCVKPRSARVISFVNTLGNTTYASYLLHFPIQLLVANLMWGRQGVQLPVQHPGFLLGYLLLTFGLAALVYRVYEMPCQTWLRQRLASGDNQQPC
jgi:peptidoglycan/LPS O-acetylase OafA/YrhL